MTVQTKPFINYIFNFTFFLIYLLFSPAQVFVAALGLSLVVVQGLLTVMTSRCRAWTLGAQASVVAANGLSCCEACGVLLD